MVLSRTAVKILNVWLRLTFTAIWGKGGRRRAAQTTALICVSITKRVGGVFVRSSWCVCWRCKLLTSVTYWMDKRIVWGWQEKTRPSGERINAISWRLLIDNCTAQDQSTFELQPYWTWGEMRASYCLDVTSVVRPIWSDLGKALVGDSVDSVAFVCVTWG